MGRRVESRQLIQVDSQQSTVNWLVVLGEAFELGLPRLHLLLGETEVVTDLVQQGELDLVDEIKTITAVVEQRLPVEKDDVRQDIAVPAAPLVEGDAGVEALQGVEPRIEVEFAERLVVRPLFDLNSDIAQQLGELLGKPVQSVGDNFFKGRTIDREARTSGTGTVCTTHMFLYEPCMRLTCMRLTYL